MSSDVKALEIDGVSPSDETVSNGSYELQRPFLLLFKGQPTGVTKDFLDWVKGPEAQAIIKGEKVVPVSNTTG
jgi:phosphate transport system substrate-binding protein